MARQIKIGASSSPLKRSSSTSSASASCSLGPLELGGALTLRPSSLAVKPDATDDEIKAAWEDSQGGAQIFSQAVRPLSLARCVVLLALADLRLPPPPRAAHDVADVGRPCGVRRGPVAQPGPAQDRGDDYRARSDDAGRASLSLVLLLRAPRLEAQSLMRLAGVVHRWRRSCSSRTSRCA